MRKKSGFRLGSAFFGISDLGFLPYGVPIKGVIEKGLIFDDFFFVWNDFVMGWGGLDVVPFLVGGPHDTGWAVVPFHGGGYLPWGGPPPWKGTRDYQGLPGVPRGAQGCG